MNDNRKQTPGVCFVKQNSLYENVDSNVMKNGYTTEGTPNLRNRAFIDKKD